MKITSLADNLSAYSTIESEHGLSLYIEAADHKLLFDMGQSDLFLRNAAKLRVDLSQVDLAMLSHGHYDHGGGIPAFRSVNPHAPLYASCHAFGSFYSTKYIGLAGSIRQDPRLILTEGVLTLAKGITLYAFPALPDRSHIDATLTQEHDGIRIPDDFRHEQYLLIEENGKRVLFGGCSHRGVEAIVQHFAPDVLVGGFHFKNLDPTRDADRLRRAAEALMRQSTLYYTCHCTGKAPFDFLKGYMGDKLHYLPAGESVTL